MDIEIEALGMIIFQYLGIHLNLINLRNFFNNERVYL